MLSLSQLTDFYIFITLHGNLAPVQDVGVLDLLCCMLYLYSWKKAPQFNFCDLNLSTVSYCDIGLQRLLPPTAQGLQKQISHQQCNHSLCMMTCLETVLILDFLVRFSHFQPFTITSFWSISIHSGNRETVGCILN